MSLEGIELFFKVRSAYVEALETNEIWFKAEERGFMSQFKEILGPES